MATVSTALLSSRRDVNNDESPAVEVLNYRSPEGYFASMLIYIARCLNDHLHLLKNLPEVVTRYRLTDSVVANGK